MNDEFENALAWFRSAPIGWMEKGRRNLAAGAEWIWEVLQGDFHDSASTAQVVTGTVISMIPLVDQICDVRDVVANCKKINQEPDQSWHWLSLVLTLIGLFPALGSLFKGCLKVMFAGMGKAGATSGVTPRLSVQLSGAVAQLNSFLGRSEVIKALQAVKWDNPHKILANELKNLAGRLNTVALKAAFRDASDAAESMLNLVRKWGGNSAAKKAEELIETIRSVHRNADRKLGEAIQPVQEALRRLARSLEIESDMAHRAYLKTVNAHTFSHLSPTEEIVAFNKTKPGWVDNTGVMANPPLGAAPQSMQGWPNTSCYDTFHTMRALVLAPGTKLYRIVDPTSRDNSICWMSEMEFKMLKSKDDWRRRFAVWANWNCNGEFVTYTVPEGDGLKVWEGITASQQLKQSDYVLEGGARQIVVDLATMDKSSLSSRKRTGWGYDDFGTPRSLVGVPVQRNNWDQG